MPNNNNILASFREMYELAKDEDIVLTEEDKSKYSETDIELLQEQINMRKQENYSMMEDFYANGGARPEKKAEPLAEMVESHLEFEASCAKCRCSMQKTDVKGKYSVLTCPVCNNAVILEKKS